MTDFNDELEELLAPQAARETPELRDAILRQTERRLVTRKWLRRAGKAVAVAAVFAVGVGVGVWRTSEREKVVPVPVLQTEVVAVPVPVPVAVPVASGSRDQAPPPVVALTAAKLEVEGELAYDPAAAAKFYRQAGDKYLNEEQDYANAARCYRLFLARAGDTALLLEPGDSWLLTSLKNAAYKEKINATSTDG